MKKNSVKKFTGALLTALPIFVLLINAGAAPGAEAMRITKAVRTDMPPFASSFIAFETGTYLIQI